MLAGGGNSARLILQELAEFYLNRRAHLGCGSKHRMLQASGVEVIHLAHNRSAQEKASDRQ